MSPRPEPSFAPRRRVGGRAGGAESGWLGWLHICTELNHLAGMSAAGQSVSPAEAAASAPVLGGQSSVFRGGLGQPLYDMCLQKVQGG